MAVTENGVIIERFPEVLNNIEANQRELIDPDIINRDDEVLSEINVILAEQIAKANEFVEAVRDSWDIANAEGVALDNLLALKKVFRTPASKSYTNKQVFVGKNGTNVPAGRKVKSTTTNKEYVLTSNVNISLVSTYRAELTVGTVANSTVYVILIAGNTYTYTSDASATATEIYNGIQALFTATPLTGVTLTSSLAEGIIIDSGDASISIAVTSNIAIDKVYTKGRVEALETGAQIEPSNSLTQLTLPVTGLLETYNEDALVVGRLVESDEDFRLRGIQTLSSSGTGTVPVIEASLLNIAGVTNARVIENDTAFTVDDLTPHSYKVIISGGEDEEIARDIWRTKPSGIRTIGEEVISFSDNRNISRTVRFQRPTPIILAIKAEYTLYSEEYFPPSGVSAIRAQIIEYVNSLGIGKDVIPKRIAALAYPPTVEGIDDITVEIQVISASGVTPDPLDWQADRLPIANDEYATVSDADIYITEV